PLARVLAGPPPAPPTQRIIFCEMNGAWDLLLSCDPRDPARTYAGIELGSDLLASRYRDPRPATIGTGSFARSTLLGSTTRALDAHLDVLTLVRGMTMATVAHPTGRAYMATGIAPAGSNARGSSLGAALANAYEEGGAPPILPHVAMGTLSFNRQFPPTATALGLDSPHDLPDLLTPNSRNLSRNAMANGALEALLASAREGTCITDAYTPIDPSTGAPAVSPSVEAIAARDRLARIEDTSLASRFDFSTPSAQALYGSTVDQRSTPASAAATAAELVKSGLSAAVGVRLQSTLDTHRDWATDQPALLEEAFDALGAMLTDLRDAGELETTMVVVHSEFGRQPTLNGSSSRDHWFANGAMIFGGPLVTGVFGETGQEDLGLVLVDPRTGRASDAGDAVQLRPEHLFATLQEALGLASIDYRYTALPLVRA
ncbi:MAG: DUF1501 domain-containing protein, partial [Deltaproteobacteria bacterium]|nr:DUF1501 domain-containing protein [Deltaproteobacteria bacterium]